MTFVYIYIWEDAFIPIGKKISLTQKGKKEEKIAKMYEKNLKSLCMCVYIFLKILSQLFKNKKK